MNRIDALKEKISSYLSDIRYKIKLEAKLFWKDFTVKGHERLTIMFIPHSEKKIFNFQISYFSIWFISILAIVVGTFSTFSIIEHSATKQEVSSLKKDEVQNKKKLAKIIEEIHVLNNKFELMKPEIEKIYRLGGASIAQAKSLWAEGESDEELILDTDGDDNTIYPGEVYDMKKIELEIETATKVIKTIKTFLLKRHSIIKETPSSWPVLGGHITSVFGWRKSPFTYKRSFHTGIDIAAPPGTPISTTASGTVVVAGWSGGYGLCVKIEHKYGFMTVYGHCQRLSVKVGDTVKKGQVIAYVGNTGRATGYHCHYEVRIGETVVNPYPYLNRID